MSNAINSDPNKTGVVESSFFPCGGGSWVNLMFPLIFQEELI